jgi:hypothetical protein
MAKKELRISQLYILKEELSDILSHELSMVLRYKFRDLFNKVSEKVANAEKIKDELIKKYGEPSTTNPNEISVTPTITDAEGKETPNPKFQEFISEFAPVLDEKEEIESKELKLSQLEEIKTAKELSVIFEFIEE